MKEPRLVIICLSILMAISCQKPVEVFQIDTVVQQKTLKLYKDSTFVEVAVDGENTYEYSGIWTGDLKEGSTFKTIAIRKGNQIITLTPTHEYRVFKGDAAEIDTKQE